MNLIRRTEMATKAKATETLEATVEAGKVQFDNITAQAQKHIDELTVIAKGNYDALLASGQAAQKGFKAISEVATAYGKTAAVEAQDAFKTLQAVKTPKEFFDVQATAAKTAFDKFVGEFSKMSEMYVKFAGEVSEPVSNRVAVVMDKVTKKAA
jgi:phasin family protein